MRDHLLGAVRYTPREEETVVPLVACAPWKGAVAVPMRQSFPLGVPIRVVNAFYRACSAREESQQCVSAFEEFEHDPHITESDCKQGAGLAKYMHDLMQATQIEPVAPAPELSEQAKYLRDMRDKYICEALNTGVPTYVAPPHQGAAVCNGAMVIDSGMSGEEAMACYALKKTDAAVPQTTQEKS